MEKKNWRKKIVYALYIFIILNMLMNIERMVFDVLGQMWMTLMINGLIGLSSILCLLGVYFRKKSIIIIYILLAVLSLGVNVLVILIYNNVGLLNEMEQYLSFPATNNKNWWSNHGFLCYTVCSDSDNNNNDNNAQDDGSGVMLDSEIDGSGEQALQACFISYTVIESFHGSVNTLLILTTIFLCSFLLFKKKSSDEDINRQTPYMGIGRYGGDALSHNSNDGPKRHTFYKLSDSFSTVQSNPSYSSSM